MVNLYDNITGTVKFPFIEVKDVRKFIKEIQEDVIKLNSKFKKEGLPKKYKNNNTFSDIWEESVLKIIDNRSKKTKR